jgi:predicted Zn-dependent protease
MRHVKWALAVITASAVAHAQADIFTPSKADQLKLGKRVAESIRREEKVLPAADIRVKVLRRIGARVLSTIKEDAGKPWEYSFDVVEDKSLNAFALPGGPIFFTTGILDVLETEDQIAAILGHEITHVRKEHWARSYADQQKRALGLTLLLTILKANRTVSDIAGIANEVVLTLPYSRRMETEADDAGFAIMVEAGFNPQGMVDVFETLKKASKGGKPPEFLSTHPDDGNRIKRISQKLSSSGSQFSPQRPLPF